MPIYRQLQPPEYRMPLSVVLQVSTEGDAFTMAFHDPIDAISWALDVQHKLLLLPWPQELLNHADAKERYTPAFLPKQILLFKGLRVRMAMHTGKPDAIQVSSAYFTVLCCAVLCCAVLCSTALPCAVLCCAVFYCAVLCCRQSDHKGESHRIPHVQLR